MSFTIHSPGPTRFRTYNTTLRVFTNHHTDMLTKLALFVAAAAGVSAFQATPALNGVKSRNVQVLSK